MLKDYPGFSSRRGFEIRNKTFSEQECRTWCLQTQLCAAAAYNVVNNTCRVHVASQVRHVTTFQILRTPPPPE